MRDIIIIVFSALVSLCIVFFTPIVPYHATLISVCIFVLLCRLLGVISISASICYGAVFLLAPFIVAILGLMHNFPFVEAFSLAFNTFIKSEVISMESAHILLGLVLSLLIRFISPVNKALKNGRPTAAL